MLFLFISCFSFIMLSQISFLKSFMEMKSELGTLILPWILEPLSLFFVSSFKRSRIHVTFFKVHSFIMLSIYKLFSSKAIHVEIKEEMSLLDLPDLALDCVLQKLSPAELSNMAGVCVSLRKLCVSDYFWERHMKHRWGRVIGGIAYKEWECDIASKKEQGLLDCSDRNGIFRFLSFKMLKVNSRRKLRTSLPVDSIMAWYISLDSGKYWFPGQVFNRENGHVGFMLSCYDAELCYNSCTDNFRARFSAQGRATMEHDIEWNRIRASTVETPSHTIHRSDCLNDLKPGDDIEIQWRRNKDFAYGWWYGVVGHLKQCNGCELNCQCHDSDTVMLEFKQYTPGSRWREIIIDRKDHTEIGDEADGFYGGIKKVYNEDEIAMWQRIWQMKVMD